MRRLDGVYLLVKNPVVQRQARRFGVLGLILVVLLGMAGSSVPTVTRGETGAASAARLWSSGAELNSTTADMEVTNTSGTVSISNSTKRSGDYAYRANPSSSTGTFYKTWATSAQTNKFWFRTYLYIATEPSADTYVFTVGNGSSGKISLRMSTSQTLQLRNEEDNANIGSASSALSKSTWYRVEVFIDTTSAGNATADDDAELRINGVSVASSTSLDLAAGVERLTWGVITSTTADLYFDDIAINDSTGRTDNWAGEGKIVHLQPDATGDNGAWTGTNTDIDEVTPDDNSTFINSTTATQIEDVNLESASSAGISSSDFVKLVSVGQRYRRCDSGLACLSGGSDTHNLRVKASSGGTLETVAVTDSEGTNYQTHSTTATHLYQLTLYDLPGSSLSPWTAANLDTTQVGVENVTVDQGTRVTALWLLVEYVPDSGGRIWSSGFELNSTAADVEFTSTAGASPPTIVTSPVRSGTYALQTPTVSTATTNIRKDFSSTDSDGDYYLRVYMRITSYQFTTSRIIEFRDTTDTRQAWLNMSNAGVLSLFYNAAGVDTQIGSNSSALNLSQWYRIEMRVNRGAGASDDIVDARIDGTSFASASNLTVNAGFARLGIGQNMNIANQRGVGQIVYDDIALNQAGGTNQASWPGPGAIVHLYPNATGDNSETWTSAGSGADTACDAAGDANWQCVDEVTPDDAVTYIEETTSGDYEDFNLQNSSFGALDTVNLVSVGVRFRTSSATQEDFRVRLKDATSAVPIESDILSPASTTWVTNKTASPFLYPLTAYTRPEQDTAWTDTELDTAQIGVRDISGSGTVQVSTLWLLVEYIPSVAGTVYQTNESSVLTTGPTVRAYSNGLKSGSAVANGSGVYTIINGDVSPGDVLAVYLDGSTEKAATYTVTPGSDISGIDLYQDRLATRCDNSCSLTNANIDLWDKNNDTDIHATVASSNLTVDNDWKLFVKQATYAPGGTVTTSNNGSNSYSGDLTIGSGATLNIAANALSVGGSYDNDGTQTLSSGQTTTLTSLKTDETLSDGSGAFENLEIDNGLVGYWKFDEGTGTNSPDASGDAQTGTFSGSPSWTTSVKDATYYGANPGAVTFNGSNRMSLTAGSPLKPSNNVTVAGWIKTGATDTNGAEMVSMGDDYAIRITTGGNVNVFFYDGTTWRTCTSSGVNVLDNAWHSIVYLKGSTGGQKIYIDNVQRDPGTGDCTNNNNISYAHGTGFNVGRHGNGDGNYDFNGSIDDVRVYNRVWSTTEISNFNSGAHPSIGTYTLQDALDINSNLGVRTGKLDVSSGNNYAITVFGNLTNVANFAAQNGSVTFDGTASGKTIQSDPTFYSFAVNGASGAWTLDKQRLDIDNTFTLTNGTFDTSASSCYNSASCNVTVDSNFTGASGTWTLTMRSATFTISGNWDTSAVATDSTSIVEGSSTVIMNGTGTKTITTGSTNTFEPRFWNLQVGTASGRITQMGQSFGWAGVLTLGAGTLDLNSKNIYATGNTASPLSLNASGTWGTGNGSLYFYGSLNMNVPGFVYNSGLNNEVSNATKITLQGTTTFTGTVTLGCCSRASELDTGNQTLTIGGNVVFNTNTAILTAGSSTITVGGSWTNQSGAVFTAGTSTVIFNATTTGKTITSASDSFNNLTFNGSGGGWTISDTMDVNADMTVVAGTVSGTQNINVDDDLICNVTCGTLNFTGGTFTLPGGAVDFGTTALASNWTFSSLTLGTAAALGTTTANGTGTITVTSVLTVNDSHAFSAGAKTYTLSGTSGTPFVTTSAIFTADTSTVKYTGNNAGGNTTINNVAYYSLVVGATPLCANETYVLTATLSISNDLTIESCGILDTVSGQNYAITIGGNYSNSGTFTAQNGTVTFDATDTGNTLSGTLSGSSAFYNLVFGATSTPDWTPSAALAVTNDLTMTAGSLLGTQNVTVNGNVAGTAGIINLTGGTFEQRSAANKNFGTTSGSAAWTFSSLTFSNSAVSAVTFTTQTGGSGGITVSSVMIVGKSGDGARTILNAGNRTWTLSGTGGNPLQVNNDGNNSRITGSTSTFSFTGNNGSGNTTIEQNTSGTYNHVTVNNGSETFVLEGNTTVGGNLTITAGTLDVVSGQNYALTVTGNWSNSGTFTARNGTVTLNGTSTQTLSGTMTSGSAFYNLTLTNASGTNASDCALTSWVPGIDFAASATVSNNYTITTASVRVEYNNASTYTVTNINWNGQASGTKIYFRNSSVGGGDKWNLNVSGTQTAVSYVNVARSDASSGNTVNAADGTNTDCSNNTNWSFAAPSSPASLVQKKTDDTVIATAGWTNETSVKFTADIADGDNPASIQLCVEKDLLVTSFSNTEDQCGSLVAYSGSPVSASVTISGLVDTSEYHWQARVKDSGGAYSAWVSYDINLETDRDFGVDTTACTYASSVYDGTTEDVDDVYNTGALDTLSANWDAFSCGVSGLSKYQYSIGTTAAGTDIKNWTDNSTTESVTSTSLNLHTNQNYFINVRAVDNASNTSSTFSSNGQTVLPTISFSMGAATITFADLNDTNNRSDTETLTLTASTNAYKGFTIRQYAAGLLTGGATTIPMFQGGSYASPAAWPSAFCTSGSNCGYGYTSSDTTIGGSDKFGGATLYAPFSLAAFGDIVADHTADVTGTSGAVVNEQHTITHKVAVDALQNAKTYQAEVIYILTGTF